MIQFSFDVSVIVLFGLHQPIRSSASGAALANQKLSCWVPLLLEQLWPIRSSASGAALANQKLSCWVPLGTVTGFHTKPPIMPYFSGFRSVQFIIQRWFTRNECGGVSSILSNSVFVQKSLEALKKHAIMKLTQICSRCMYPISPADPVTCARAFVI